MERILTEFDTYRWMEGHLGGSSAYPGHPLVLATIIMYAFETFAAANEPTPDGWPEALADSRVPGAGDHVHAAMRVLRLGDGGASVDAMVAEANRYWVCGRAGGHVANVAEGSEQSVRVEPVFRAKAESWLLLNPQPV